MHITTAAGGLAALASVASASIPIESGRPPNSTATEDHPFTLWSPKTLSTRTTRGPSTTENILPFVTDIDPPVPSPSTTENDIPIVTDIDPPVPSPSTDFDYWKTLNGLREIVTWIPEKPTPRAPHQAAVINFRAGPVQSSGDPTASVYLSVPGHLRPPPSPTASVILSGPAGATGHGPRRGPKGLPARLETALRSCSLLEADTPPEGPTEELLDARDKMRQECELQEWTHWEATATDDERALFDKWVNAQSEELAQGLDEDCAPKTDAWEKWKSEAVPEWRQWLADAGEVCEEKKKLAKE